MNKENNACTSIAYLKNVTCPLIQIPFTVSFFHDRKKKIPTMKNTVCIKTMYPTLGAVDNNARLAITMMIPNHPKTNLEANRVIPNKNNPLERMSAIVGSRNPCKPRKVKFCLIICVVPSALIISAFSVRKSVFTSAFVKFQVNETRLASGAVAVVLVKTVVPFKMLMVTLELSWGL